MSKDLTIRNVPNRAQHAPICDISNLPAGTYNVKATNSGGASNADKTFTLTAPAPHINGLSAGTGEGEGEGGTPSQVLSGHAGDTITIYGDNFGTQSSNSKVQFTRGSINGSGWKNAQIVSWNANNSNKITVTVPTLLAPSGCSSSRKYFIYVHNESSWSDNRVQFDYLGE